MLESALRSWRNSRRKFGVMVLLWAIIFTFDHGKAQQFRVPAANGNGHFGTCYDDYGNPQKCVPEFVNAAFDVPVEVTSTCGLNGPTEYCIQSGALGLRRACDFCDAYTPRLSHPPSYLTDLTTTDNETWWQSETMFEGIQWPHQVNLTLRLRKAFDITYIRLKFHSPRPESFAIYRRASEDSPWVPYQYYSATCRDFYGLPDLGYIHGGDETRPLCISDFSDISPLTGGNVAFSTLEGRPSAFNNFENSKELQEWVTATEIMVSLDRLNTFGDEVFGDEKVLRSYFYAISDFAVGGTCKCNGHASECLRSSGQDRQSRLVCRCEHNTAGPDCGECLPFYNDVPWGRATSTDVHECKPCNCNGFSDRCFFDQKLYEASGHGGHCLECAGNRGGANCEQCKPNYYQRPDGYCILCHCNEQGSRSLQCNAEGKCQCQPGVAGDKCDRCAADYYGLTKRGCTECSCSVAGSFGNSPSCDNEGFCTCKGNVEGKKCDKCKPGFFNLDLTNDFGCTPCFCYGHSAICRSSPGYGQVVLESNFALGPESWTAEETYGKTIPLQYNAFTQNIGVSAPGREPVYFVAPARYLGDQRSSYNQAVNFTLRIGEHSQRPSAEDVILEGAGLRISRPIFGQGNFNPSIQDQNFTFRLHEHPDFGWNPRLSSRDFISILSKLTGIKVRGTYSTKGVAFLDNVRLTSAKRGAGRVVAPWVETCTCPEGYIGQFCESCDDGYTHEPKGGGPFARCVECSCNGHAKSCDPETGSCICEHNTGGENCERCARGYFGSALVKPNGTCQPCPCPGKGACVQLADNTTVCLECPEGRAGPLCEFCGDGFWGDPATALDPLKACLPCDCNKNIDLNAVGNCNRTTGECLKCIYNTGGPKCDKCNPGFYGDPLGPVKGDCKPCDCEPMGSRANSENKFICDQPLGKCHCKENVEGRRCDTCKDGYFDLASGEGCRSCDCDLIGSLNVSCNVRTGQCHCREGIIGLRCNECAPNHYGFSLDGCKPCACDQIGSLSLQCDPNGQCPCRENVEGRACERCKENKYDRQAGCRDCKPCYNLVQDAVNAQRSKLVQMEKLLEDIKSTPTVINDVDFERKLGEVQQRVNAIWTEAKSATAGQDKSMLEQVSELQQRIQALNSTAAQIKDTLNQCLVDSKLSTTNLTKTEEAVARAQEALKGAQRFLDSDGKEALARAEEKSLEYGQQRTSMSEFAKEARALADSHEKDASEIETLAGAAQNTSKAAYELAWNSINSQRTLTDESRILLTSSAQLDEEVKATHGKAKDALDKAKSAYNNALNLFKDAYSLGLPDVDVQKIKEQATRAKEDAAKLKASVTSLLAEKETLLRESEEEVLQSRKQLENALRQKDQAEKLLAELNQAKLEAEQARNQSENTFKDAQEIFDTLQDFNRNVAESKEKAGEAKKLIPQISELISEAETQTRANQRALRGANEKATKALGDADEAKKIAEKASKDAGAILAEVGETKSKASELKDETGALNVRATDTFTTLIEAEAKVGNDDAEVKGALEKASEAGSTATKAYDRVTSALDSVRDIQLALDNLDTIDEAALEGLERRINEVEAEFNEAELELKIAELREARNKQIHWIKSYEDELEALQSEVENVKAIRDSLPPDDKCWKRIRLEP